MQHHQVQNCEEFMQKNGAINFQRNPAMAYPGNPDV
jgi:hypothetical protein